MKNLVNIKSKTETTTPSVGVDGQELDAWFDQYGRLVTTERNILVDVTPTLDNGTAYADEDLLFDATAVSSAVFQGGSAVLESLTVIDKDDEGAAFDIYFLDVGTSLGTINDAEAMTDAMLSTVLTKVSVAGADYVDLANGQIVTKSASGGDAGMGVILQPSSSTSTSVWVAGVSQGTPTYTAADDLVLRIGLRRA